MIYFSSRTDGIGIQKRKCFLNLHLPTHNGRPNRDNTSMNLYPSNILKQQLMKAIESRLKNLRGSLTNV